MMYVLDRFEGEIAVIEKSDQEQITFVEINRSLLPSDTEEGDVLVLSDSGWSVDKEATAQRRSQIQNRLKRMGLL